MDRLWQDSRFGIRTMIKSPGFAAAAAVTLALGIGANTAVFSAVNAVLLKPLPFADPDRLVMVFDVQPEVPRAPASFPIYVDWRDENRVFTLVGGSSPRSVVLTGSGDPTRVNGASVTSTFFTVLDVPPFVGRPISAEEDQPGGPKAVVLSYRLWEQRFGADPELVGRTITLDGEPHLVVGVMPPGFDYPQRAQLWLPLARAFDETTRDGHFMRVVARLKPDVTFEQARTEMEALGQRLSELRSHPHGTTIRSFGEFLVGNSGRPLLVLLGAASFVLLIACVNVANLLLARAVSRERELAVRVALGAGRVRLLRQLLTESVALALLGGGLGVVAAGWLIRLFMGLAPASFPRLADIGVDLRVLAATAAASVLTGVVFGMLPAMHALRANPNQSLRDGSGKTSGGARARRANRLLVTTEVALALVLLVGAGLMVKSLYRLQAEDPGISVDRLLTFQVELTSGRYDSNETGWTFYRDLLDRLRALPGIESAGGINLLPLDNWGWNTSFQIEGHEPWPAGQEPIAEHRAVTSDYFGTMGIPVVRGRAIDDRDTAAAASVVMINDSFARQFFENEDPIGRRIVRGGVPVEIVGVAADVKQSRLDRPTAPEIYHPITQATYGFLAVVVRARTSDPLALVPAVREQVAALDPDLPITQVATMRQVVSASVRQPRLSSTLIGLFAALAALMATVGVYGVMSYSVSERTRELGIRIALGADARSVMRLVVAEGLTTAGVGTAVGALASVALTRVLGSQLYEVSPTDPLVLGATAAGVLVVAMAAALVPARRAMRVDPMVALRAE